MDALPGQLHDRCSDQVAILGPAGDGHLPPGVAHAPRASLSRDQKPVPCSGPSPSWAESSAKRRRCSSLRCFGVQTWTLTLRSPITLELSLGRPFCLSLSTAPDWVPAGTSSSWSPQGLGTCRVIPSAAWEKA